MSGEPNEIATSMVWLDDRTYELRATPYWCDSCGEQGVPSLRDGAVCLLCGAENWEPFRVGWDESD